MDDHVAHACSMASEDLLASPQAWLFFMRLYLAVLAVGDLAWEFAQMPFYTLWRTGSPSELVFAAVHCTGGDVLIAGMSLLGGLLLFGAADWPRSRFLAVTAATWTFGLGYTVYSEHVNLLHRAWSYSEQMPIVPGLGTGVLPLAQWVVVPLATFGLLRRAFLGRSDAA